MLSKVSWKGNMKFSGMSGSGHEVMMDSATDHGGEDSAARPKEMVLHGLGGCTAMDVISILKKMRIEPGEFRVEINADQTEEHPMVFKKIHLKYIFKGNLDHDKAQKAVALSQTKYCGVSEMLRHSAEISYEIVYEQ